MKNTTKGVSPIAEEEVQMFASTRSKNELLGAGICFVVIIVVAMIVSMFLRSK